jgi:hypothetical protein
MSVFSTGDVSITVKWQPPPGVIAAELDQMAVDLNNMVAPLTASRDIYIGGINEAFDSKVAPGGGAWAPWDEDYAFYAQNVNVGGLMERTGALRGAATSPGSYTITAREVFFSGPYPGYGDFHLSGTGKMPARPWLGMSAETEAEILSVWQTWFEAVTSW